MILFNEKNNNNLNFLLLHIPKNSGRYMRDQVKNKYNVKSISDIIKDYFPHLEDIDENDWPVEIKNIIYDNHIKYGLIKNIYNVNKTFVFIRNPYDRFISAYFHTLPYKKYGIITKRIEKLINEFSLNFTDEELLIYNKEITLESPFEEIRTDFIERTKLIKKLNDNNISIFFPILYIPQYKFILEDVDNEELGISPNITIYKLEDYETNTEAQNFFQFENFNLKRYNYLDYYDDECLSIINEVYKKDFELLDYDKITSL